MNIRLAQWEDTETICYLLKQMGYSQPLKVVQEQFQVHFGYILLNILNIYIYSHLFYSLHKDFIENSRIKN